MSLVLDASLTLSWYFEDERTPAIDAVLDQVVASGAHVPSLWRIEVANGFQMAIRRKRIDRDFRDRAIRHLGLLPIVVDLETDTYVWTAMLRLADRFRPHGLRCRLSRTGAASRLAARLARQGVERRWTSVGCADAGTQDVKPMENGGARRGTTSWNSPPPCEPRLDAYHAPLRQPARSRAPHSPPSHHPRHAQQPRPLRVRRLDGLLGAKHDYAPLGGDLRHGVAEVADIGRGG